jgi:hypothetical protein
MSVFIGPRWLKFRFGRRGTRVLVGPRWLQLHGGAGGPGVSSGAGPVSVYHGFRRSRRRR